MSILKNSLYYGIIVFAVWFGFHTYTKTPCDQVIEYDIFFDDRFRITENEFISFLERAETPWENAAGTELFRYVPGSTFKVNLIFSEKQARLYQGRDISSELDSQQLGIDSLQSRYQSVVRRYEFALKEYENQLRTYEQNVGYWNTKGGAPTDIYAQLQNDETRLDAQFKEVETLRRNVNQLAEENNNQIQDYNDGVSNYNDLFKDSKQFDAGNTDGTEINIYSYDGNQELMTLITHEFGHLLGIDHIDDESSVMYFLLNEKNKGGILSTADINALSVSCR